MTLSPPSSPAIDDNGDDYVGMGWNFLNVSTPLHVKGNRPHIFAAIDNALSSGLDYLLGHFEEPLWPRTISTKTTEGRQLVVFNRLEALARFKQANGLDCRINAYPNYVEWNGVNRQPPNFIFIDLDMKKADCHDDDLAEILGTTCGKFDDYNIQPTVLLSGTLYHYHVYLPVKAFVLESESLFSDFEQPSRKFIQWAEQYLSDNKADPLHSKGLSFKNCMLRVPGSINSKVNKEVQIIQSWNGRRPSIRPLLEEFYIDITEDKINEIQYSGRTAISASNREKVFNYWRGARKK